MIVMEIPSDYNPTEIWKINIKERYDFIYCETKGECQAKPKSFVKNTKYCCFQKEKYMIYLLVLI